MKMLRWFIPAFAIALLPLWACQTEEQAGETTIIEDTEPDIIVEDTEPDIIDDTDGVQGEVRVGEDGVEGEIRVDEN